MTKTITVFVPCDVVPIRVRYGYGASVSPIELTVLEAITARAATVPRNWPTCSVSVSA